MLAALATGSTIESAAKAGRVSPRTVRRRLGESWYRHQLHRLRQESLTRAALVVSAGVEAAARVLVELLHSESDQVRLRAASALLDRHGPLRDLSATHDLSPEEILARGLMTVDLLKRADGQPVSLPDEIPRRYFD